MGRGAVAAVFPGRPVGGRLHAGEDLTGQPSAADRIERQCRAGRNEGLGEIVSERRAAGVHYVHGADGLQNVHVLPLAYDVHQSDAVLDADIVQHLTQVRGRSRVHKGGMAFRTHGLDHAECGEWIHEAGSAFRRCGARR